MTVLVESYGVGGVVGVRRDVLDYGGEADRAGCAVG